MITDRQLVCLAALAMESLVRERNAWRYGRRGRVFGNATVKALIDRGLATRVGDRVVGILPLNDNGVEL